MKKNYKVEYFKSKNDWLNMRGIGGTSASVILGLNPWKSNIDLYLEILNVREKQAKTTNTQMALGIKLEPLIRKEFAYDFPQMSVWTPKRNAMFRSTIKPYLTATVDGTLKDKSTGKKYILEIKTHDYRNAEDRANWENSPPIHYFIQVLHYLNVLNDYDGAVICARLRDIDFYDEKGKKTTHIEYKYYWLERSNPDIQKWLKYIYEEEVKFMENNIAKHIPPLNLKLQIGETNTMNEKLNVIVDTYSSESKAYHITNYDEASRIVEQGIINAHIDQVITNDDEFKDYKKRRAEINNLCKTLKGKRIEINESVVGELNSQFKLLEKKLEDADKQMKKSVDEYSAVKKIGDGISISVSKPTAYALVITSYNKDLLTKIISSLDEETKKEISSEIKEIK